MTTQVGSAVAKYGAYGRLGMADQGGLFGSMDRSAAWDSLGRHSTISGTIQQQCQENWPSIYLNVRHLNAVYVTYDREIAD